MESFLAQQQQAHQHNDDTSRQGDSNNAPAPTDPTASLMASLAAGGLIQGQQQNGNVPLLVGATPLQQQLSALAELTGAMNSSTNPTGSNASQQQPAFSFAPQPAATMNQLLNPQQLLMQQFQQQQQQHQQQQQQQQQTQQQAPAASFASPQFGLNLQQLQQLQLAQQLFQAGLAGGLGGFPGGLNLQQPAAAANNPTAALQAQLMVLAGAMGQQQPQQPQPQAQQMLSTPMAAGTPQALMAALQQQQQQQQSQQQQPQLGLAAQNPLFGQSAEAFAAALKPDALGGVDHSKVAGGVANAATDADWAEPFSGKGKKEPPFPLKLHQILSNPEFQECICWNAHGRSWRILKPPLFEQIVIPLYFRHAKYASFMRQVNGWGFKRIVSGNDHNSYYHELFVRDMPQLCLKMKRIKRSDVEKPPKYRDAADKDHDSGNESDGSPPAPAPAATTNATNTSSTAAPSPAASAPAMVASTQSSYAPSSTGMQQDNFNFLQNSMNAQATNGSQNMASASQLAGMFGITAAGGGGGNTSAAPSTEAIQGLLMGGGSTGAQVGGTPWSNAAVPAAPSTATNTEQHVAAAADTPAATHASPFAGLDAATLAKLQEALASASGGGNVSVASLLQQQQQQHQSSASSDVCGGGLNLMNNGQSSNAAMLMAQLQAATQHQPQQQQQASVDADHAVAKASNAAAAEPV